MSFDVNKFAGDVTSAIKQHIDPQMAKMSERLTALEAREPQKGADGVGIVDGGIDQKGLFFLTLSNGEKKTFGKVVGENGKDADPVNLSDLAKSAADLIEVPKAPEIDLDAVAKAAAELVPQAEIDVEAITKNVLSKMPELPELPAIDIDAIAKAAAELVPTPENGKDADPIDLEAVAKAAAALIPTPKDGEDAAPVDFDAVVKAAVAQIPVPQDGVGFEDMRIEHDGERGFKFVFEKDDVVKEFEFSVPVMINRGTHKGADETRTFEKGDVVTYGGALWCCTKDTSGKPGETRDWQLSVKRGTDGKPGERGLPGARGRDMTAAR